MLKYRKIFYLFSGTLVIISIVAFFLFGIKLGIDFTGGSLLEISVSDKALDISSSKIEEILEKDESLKLGDIKVQSSNQTFVIRSRTLKEEERQKTLDVLQKSLTKDKPVSIQQIRFESVGSSIGVELKEKAILQIGTVLIGIMLYVAYAFRKVAHLKEKSKISWKFGIIAIITVFHDVIITLGLFSILGKAKSVEVDSSFVAAILMVLGYSVNDTIVVFDRIRENLIKHKLFHNLEKIINQSISETIVRSLNTSTTTILVLVALLLFGGPSIFYFVLALTVGISVGTYSSIAIASPLLYEWEKTRK